MHHFYKYLIFINLALFVISATGGTKEANLQKSAFNRCKTKLLAAQRLGVLYDIKIKPGQEPYVLVGPTFFSISIDAKEGFAQTVSCMLTDNDNGCMNFDLRSYLTGKPVAQFHHCKLSMN